MVKSNLIFDFDDTMFLTSTLLTEYMNKRWNMNSTESDYLDSNGFKNVITKYHPELNNLTNEEIYIDYRENLAMSAEWHKRVVPMPSMIKVVGELKGKYNLFVATKRSDNSQHIVKSIINQFIPNCIEDIFFAIKYKNGSYTELKKADYILSLEGKNVGFVDDSLSEIQQTKDIVPSFLFDHRNMFQKIDEINILKDWEEIGIIFL